jgi:hypothetical protein
VEFPGNGNSSAQRSLHQSLHTSMERALSDLGIDVETLEPGQPVTRFAVRRGALTGQARLVSMISTQSSPSRAMLAACFHDQREPALGARVCDRLLASYEQPGHEDSP